MLETNRESQIAQRGKNRIIAKQPGKKIAANYKQFFNEGIIQWLKAMVQNSETIISSLHFSVQLKKQVSVLVEIKNCIIFLKPKSLTS